jgi:TetR/AcrR family tetracycline transcriptional repressor
MQATRADTRLTRERIVDAALAVVDAEGWDALSMRRLAQELDVWPMAVYRYFRDKDELLEALVDAAAERVPLPGRPGTWRRRVSDLVREARSSLRLAAPAAPAGRALATPGGRRLSEAALAILAEAGLDPEEAERAWRGLFGYAIGFPSFDPDEQDEPEFSYGLERLLDGVEARLG